MSSYQCKIKIKKTGEIKSAYAHDDYFGKHQYGYCDGTKVYREEEVEVIHEVTELTSREKLYLLLSTFAEETTKPGITSKAADAYDEIIALFDKVQNEAELRGFDRARQIALDSFNK